MTRLASASFGFFRSASKSIDVLLDICGVQVIRLDHGVGVVDLRTRVGILCLYAGIKLPSL